MRCLRHLGDDAENDAAFEASWEYVTVQALKGLKFAVVCYFRVEYLIPQTY